MEKITNLLEYKELKECPPDLEWAIPLIEYQETQEFKDWIGYYMALGEQRALRKFEQRQREK